MTQQRRLSIRTTLLGLLIGEMTIVVGVASWMWYHNGQRAVQDVESQLRQQLSARIREHILHFVSVPDRVNQINEDAYRTGRFDLSDVTRLEEYFWGQIHVFPTISYVDVGTEAGEFIGIERLADGSMQLELKTSATNGALHSFPLDANRRRLRARIRPDYDVKGRPWYRAAIKADGPVWSEIYPFFSAPPRLGLTAVRPIRDDAGAVVGVLACDLVLTHLDQFLQSLTVGKTGRTFLIERSGMLVASSCGQPSARRDGDKLRRVHVLDSGDELIQAAARHLQQRYSTFQGIEGQHQMSFNLGDERILLQVYPIRDALGLDWLSVIVVPESDFMGAIHANTRTTTALFAGLILLAGLTIVVTTRKITRSILEVSREMNKVAEFRLSGEDPLASAFHEIHTMQSSMSTMKRALRSFAKYVPVEVVRQLIRAKREAVLGLEPAEVTLYMADITDFTAIAESLPPDTLVEMMSEYLEEMSGIIIQAGGTVDKFMGDAIMAFWNAPEPVKNHQYAAVRTALACRERVAALHAKWKEKNLPLLVPRVALHTGPVLVGNFGAHRRMDFTVIGDTVNLASRLEGLNKIYGTHVLISDPVYRVVRETYLCRQLDTVMVKGKTGAMSIYELIAPHDQTTEAQRQGVELYAQALALYGRRSFGEACAEFAKYLESVPGDRAAELLRDRCRQYETEPPPPDWDGVYAMDFK